MVCSATDGLGLISNFHSTTIGRQFLARTGVFAVHYGPAMGGPSVKVPAPRAIFDRIVLPGDGVRKQNLRLWVRLAGGCGRANRNSRR